VSMSTLPFSKVIAVDKTNANADYTTIQAAIDACADGDVIQVSPGVYNEQLTLPSGKSFRVVGHGAGVGGTSVELRLGDGYLVSSPSSGAGAVFFENMSFALLYDGLSGKSATILCNSPSYGMVFKGCKVFSQTFGAFGGLLNTVLVNCGYLEMFDCEVSSDDADFINNVKGFEFHAGNVILHNTAVYGYNNADIEVSGGSAILTLESCTVVGLLSVVQAQNILLDRVSRIGAVSGIQDNDQENIALHRNYGVLRTNGQNDLFKLNLRQLASDPASPENGDVWYNSNAGKFKAKENGSVVDVIQAPVVPVSANQASATSSATTASTSYVALDSMSLTPGAGNYVLMFGTSAENNNNNASIFFAVYVDGSVIQHTERETRRGGSSANNMDVISLQAYLPSVGAGQVVEVKWKTSAGTATARERTLVLMKI